MSFHLKMITYKSYYMTSHVKHLLEGLTHDNKYQLLLLF